MKSHTQVPSPAHEKDMIKFKDPELNMILEADIVDTNHGRCYRIRLKRSGGERTNESRNVSERIREREEWLLVRVNNRSDLIKECMMIESGLELHDERKKIK